MLPHGSREELSPSVVATSVEGFSGPTYLLHVSSMGWRVGAAHGGGHQQQLWLPAGSGALGHARSLLGLGWVHLLTY